MASFAEAERDGWNHRAPVYARTTALATTQAIPQVLAAVRPKFGDSLLDISTGPGFAAGAAAAVGCTVDGIDFAESMVEVAARNFPACRFTVGDAQALAFEEGTFDAAVCNFGIFHFADPEAAIREGARVLRPGARFAWSQWFGPDSSPFFGVVFNAVMSHADMDIGLPQAPPPFRFSDPTVAREAMKAAGFDDITLTEVPIVLHAPARTFFDFFSRFSVRMTMVLERQDPPVRERIENAIASGLAGFDDGGTLRLPMPAFVVSGRKRV